MFVIAHVFTRSDEQTWRVPATDAMRFPSPEIRLDVRAIFADDDFLFSAVWRTEMQGVENRHTVTQNTAIPVQRGISNVVP